MPLRRTERSNGRPRPRWKDGSHLDVENTHANESHCNGIALETNRQTEPLVPAPPLLKRSHENNVSTRDRLARTGADARIEESAAMGEVRLAPRHYGRKIKGDFHPFGRERTFRHGLEHLLFFLIVLLDEHQQGIAPERGEYASFDV